MGISKRELTEAEADELEALVDAAKVRKLSHEETVRGYLLMGYDQEWAEYLARYGFPLE